MAARTFITDLVEIQHEGKSLVHFDSKYVKQKRADILKMAIQRACREANCKEYDLKFLLETVERNVGYANRSYPNDEPQIYTVLSSKEIKLSDLKNEMT